MRDLNKCKSHFDKLQHLISFPRNTEKAKKGIQNMNLNSVFFNLLIHLFERASNPNQSGLEIFQHDLHLLLAASDVYRASGDREVIGVCRTSHHSSSRSLNGYVRSVQDLIALKRSEEAKAILQSGLNKFPNQKKLQKSQNSIITTKLCMNYNKTA